MDKSKEIIESSIKKDGTWKNGITGSDVKYLGDCIKKLESEKADLVEFIKDFYYDPVLCELLNVETVLKMQTLLQKHGVS